jgi:predicted house-cleaning noncanonical NTP pyrophosphatase (MazG superfamily)
MDNRLKITEESLNQIIDQEARKTVGHILNQYDLIEDKNLLKKEIKEILYQSYRNLRDMVRVVGKESINLTITKSKE